MGTAPAEGGDVGEGGYGDREALPQMGGGVMAVSLDAALDTVVDDLRAYERMAVSDEEATEKLTARILFWNSGWLGDLAQTALERYGEDSVITQTLRARERAMRDEAQRTAHELYMDCSEQFCQRCRKRRSIA